MKTLFLIIGLFLIASCSSTKKIKSDYGMVTREQRERIDKVQKPKVYKRNKGWLF